MRVYTNEVKFLPYKIWLDIVLQIEFLYFNAGIGYNRDLVNR